MTYKMVACDLDETLLNDNAKIPQANITAIKEAVDQGVFFVPDTGRGPHSVIPLLKELGLENNLEQYVISFNGGVVVNAATQKVVLSNPLGYELAQTILDAALKVKPNLSVHIYTLDQLYIFQVDPADDAYITPRIPGWEPLTSSDLSCFKDDEIYKVIFHIPDEKERNEFKEYLAKAVPTPIAITFSSDRYVECNPKGSGKGVAAVQLGEKLGITSEDIIAIGDSGNDVNMLEHVGLPVCVANGRDFLKAMAKYVTTKDNNQGAVAEVLEKVVLKSAK